ncbi:MAG TPA: zinc ribbon domain-containing protein, partial [Blastocatellia bacterium]|nr:zinc ribbon domain-containing protein [Blastocatellia bacterium]
MSTGVDQRFCPYCGKPLSQRARFCPSCGKASIQRQRSAGVIVEENAPAPKREDPYSKLTTPRPDDGARSFGRPRPTAPEREVVSRPSNGSADTGFAPPYARRIAPPTRSF